MNVEERHHETGANGIAADAAGRLNVFSRHFRLPSTTIKPSRVMSSPTEIMLVARAISTRSSSAKFESDVAWLPTPGWLRRET